SLELFSIASFSAKSRVIDNPETSLSHLSGASSGAFLHCLIYKVHALIFRAAVRHFSATALIE
ncbi:MAG: hypothetical protein J5482_05030, partial [Oscillospiraceae bacterium]|nr:hypothetical protein [Oscillospiraceae bacterium]